MKALTEHFNVPYFVIDDPIEYNEASIKYVADQLGELIEFAESRIPGVKYDRDKHLELLEAQRIAYTYVHRDWQLRRLVPLPMSVVDSFRSRWNTCQPGSLTQPKRWSICAFVRRKSRSKWAEEWAGRRNCGHSGYGPHPFMPTSSLYWNLEGWRCLP